MHKWNPSLDPRSCRRKQNLRLFDLAFVLSLELSQHCVSIGTIVNIIGHNGKDVRKAKCNRFFSSVQQFFYLKRIIRIDKHQRYIQVTIQMVH